MAIYGNSVRWVSAVSVLLGDASALHLCGYSCRCDAVLSFTVCFWCRHCLDALCLYLRYPEIIMINCFILLLSLPVLSTFWLSLMAGLICRLHFSSFLQNVEGWGPGPTQHCLSECKSDTQKSLVSRCWAPRIGRKQRFWLPSCPLDILLQPTYIFTLLIYIILYTSISFAESCLRSGQRYPGTVFCIFFILDLFIWGQAL